MMEIKDLQYKLAKECNYYNYGYEIGEAREIRIESVDGIKYIIKAYFKENGLMHYICMDNNNIFMYKKLKQYWNMDKEQIDTLFEKYKFSLYMNKATAHRVKEELEALAMMGKLVSD